MKMKIMPKIASSKSSHVQMDLKVKITGLGMVPVVMSLFYDTPSECWGYFDLDLSDYANGTQIYVKVDPRNDELNPWKGDVNNVGSMDWQDICDELYMEDLSEDIPKEIPFETVCEWYQNGNPGENLKDNFYIMENFNKTSALPTGENPPYESTEEDEKAKEKIRNRNKPVLGPKPSDDISDIFEPLFKKSSLKITIHCGAAQIEIGGIYIFTKSGSEVEVLEALKDNMYTVRRTDTGKRMMCLGNALKTKKELGVE